jgi:GAF domain-containing protein
MFNLDPTISLENCSIDLHSSLDQIANDRKILIRTPRISAFPTPRLNAVEPTSEINTLSAHLGMYAVLQASLLITEQATERCVVLELLRLIFKTAGADYILLVLPYKSSFCASVCVQADGTVCEIEETDINDEPMKWPTKIINYVGRSHQVANDVSEVSHCLYQQVQQPRSVLAFPLIDHCNLLGIIYLENRKMTGAFPKDDITILTSIVASQAASALSKARLMDDLKQSQEAILQQNKSLEARVRERTQELVQKNKDLEIASTALEIAAHEAHKTLEAKSMFLATMSHEIRTVLLRHGNTLG